MPKNLWRITENPDAECPPDNPKPGCTATRCTCHPCPECQTITKCECWDCPHCGRWNCWYHCTRSRAKTLHLRNEI